MHYVKQILLPGEHVLYDGHVHPKVLVPGFLWLGFAALILLKASGTGAGHPYFLGFFYHMAQSFHSVTGIYEKLARWQEASPDVSLGFKAIVAIIALIGISKLGEGLMLMQSIELVVTDQRVIAKRGILTVITAEMNRHRIAEIVVDQSLLGRIMGYGHIFIRGFTGTIGGLPVMVNPHLLERFILGNTRP